MVNTSRFLLNSHTSGMVGPFDHGAVTCYQVPQHRLPFGGDKESAAGVGSSGSSGKVS